MNGVNAITHNGRRLRLPRTAHAGMSLESGVYFFTSNATPHELLSFGLSVLGEIAILYLDNESVAFHLERRFPRVFRLLAPSRLKRNSALALHGRPTSDLSAGMVYDMINRSGSYPPIFILLERDELIEGVVKEAHPNRSKTLSVICDGSTAILGRTKRVCDECSAGESGAIINADYVFVNGTGKYAYDLAYEFGVSIFEWRDVPGDRTAGRGKPGQAITSSDKYINRTGD